MMHGSSFDGFDWDAANRRKCQRHGVTLETIESIFGPQATITPDPNHSQTEQRFYAIGKHGKRSVFVVFTIRQRDGKTLVRPISARYMHAKELESYEEEASRS